MIIKFLLILLAIVTSVLLGLNYLKNKIRKAMFGAADPKKTGFANFNNFSSSQQNRQKDEEVVYKKDNTVILKGEAKSKK